jgi:RimJ/RimL family protein N-acetyltransferase
VVDRPVRAPQWQEWPDLRNDVLREAGFGVARDTTRFEWLPELAPEAKGASRLQFRGLEELETAAFVAAVRAVTEGTLDQRIGDERDEAGPEAHAREFVAEMEELGRLPGWWQLGYDTGGDLVGLMMLSGNMDWATIGYVGVVPARRGEGFIDDLLVKGAAMLRETGIGRAIADTDLANRPMEAALRRHGWREFATRREYTRRLT